MSTKSDKVVPPKGKKTHTTMLIDPALTEGRRRARRKSALEEEFEAEDDAQARELRELRVEEMLMKRRARITKLQREIKEIEGPPAEAKTEEAPKIPGISINVARQIAALPEEERQRVLETYVLMQAAEAKHANAVLPAIVGFARANPGSSQNQFMEYAKAMSDQFRTGVEVAQKMAPQVPPQPPQQDQWKPMEMIMGLVKDSVKEPLEKMSERMVPQPSAFEQILMDDRLFNRAKDLGIFGGRREAGTGTSEMDLKIEELRTERDLGLKKLDLEWRKSMLEREASDKRTDAVLTALAPLSALFAGPVSQRMRQFGQQQAAAHNPGVTPTTVKQPAANTVLIQCPCGYQGTMSFPGSIPSILNCPKCDQELVLEGGAPGAGSPEETDTRTGD